MSASPHRLILASAGTGKTYQLSGRFLALLFAGVEPERILATTFTRKAAGEILDRVLRRLVDASAGAGALRALNQQLEAEGVAPVDAARCTELLAELVRGLHRFRIRTLDAFFVHLARVFALELALPPEWRILDEDEDKVLRRDSISDALARAERDEVIELLRALQKSGASKAIERTLLATVDEGRSAFLDSHAAAWDRVSAPDGLDDERLAQALEDLETMELPRTRGGKGPEAKTWIRARDELIEAVRAETWVQMVDKGILKKILEGETTYSSQDITQHHMDVLLPLLAHARHEILSEVQRQNAATLAWLDRFEAAYAERKDLDGGLVFDDLPRALAPLDGVPLAASGFDLWFRLDGRVDHLLLDEFQDTAPSQWRVLEPLAEEIVSDGTGERSFFCVGDVKQSIYAWRSGEPRLLAEMPERFRHLPDATELSQSWRSSQVVLSTVDLVFQRIGDNAAFEGQRSYRDAARKWQEDYRPHIAARELPGAAWLLEARPPHDDEDPDVPTLELAAERAAAIASEAPHATIAVLLRRNAHVARMIYLLRQRGLRASSEGGNPLLDSAAVLHALSALHLADHPGDTSAAFHVCTSPLAAILGVGERDALAPAALSRRLRDDLARLGFGELLGTLLPAVHAAEGYGAWDRKRFAQLVDLGYAFDRREELRADAFLAFVRDTPVEDPSSTQVKVMTTHAAKGLEFDAVILPELDLRFLLRDFSVLRRRPVAAKELTGVSCSRSHAVCELDPDELAPMRHEEDVRAVREALCLLYVGLTRAAHRLDIIVRHRKQPRIPGTYAGVLRDALGNGPATEGGVLWHHPESCEAWWPPPPQGEPPAPEDEEPDRLPRFRKPTHPRALPRRSPSAEEGGALLAVEDLLRPRRAGGFTRGTLIHRWLEEVEWLEDFGAGDDELSALGHGIERDEAARREALTAFRAALAGEELQALLTRARQAGADEELEVWRERGFSEIVPDPDGGETLWTGSFDRVVLRRRGGELTGAEVLDYKTDRVAAAGVEARAAFYAPQLAGYRRVLARMTGLAEEAVAATLVFLEPGVVRRLPR
ncbi:MAG: UvrD-helicase domain-containing protein [Planctomycetota bacterium]